MNGYFNWHLYYDSHPSKVVMFYDAWFKCAEYAVMDMERDLSVVFQSIACVER